MKREVEEEAGEDEGVDRVSFVYDVFGLPVCSLLNQISLRHLVSFWFLFFVFDFDVCVFLVFFVYQDEKEKKRREKGELSYDVFSKASEVEIEREVRGPSFRFEPAFFLFFPYLTK